MWVNYSWSLWLTIQYKKENGVSAFLTAYKTKRSLRFIKIYIEVWVFYIYLLFTTENITIEYRVNRSIW